MRRRPIALAALCLIAPTLEAAPADSLPIREITAFKDGHAIVLRSGSAPADDRGRVVLDDPPRAIMGAFWADSDDPNARLVAVTAAVSEVPGFRTVAGTEDLLRANTGRQIAFRDSQDELRTGTVAEVLDADSNRSSAIILVRTDADVAAVPVGSIKDLRFLGGPPATRVASSEQHATLTLDLAWDGRPQNAADISIMTIQQGVRWIPSYRVTVLDDDTVRVELQATLINELADLDDATVHLAVGVPSFALAGTPDPMGLADRLDDLGLYFRRSDARTGSMFSNAIRSQAGFGSSPFQSASDDEATALPELTGSERAEDLFVFTASHVTLAKGARMSLPLVSYDAPYSTVYALDLPASAPVSLAQNIDNEQQRRIARALARPAPRHLLRIRNENDGRYPVTTAPAIVVKNGRTLAQGLLTYAAPGSAVDLDIGSAVEIAADTDETETSRTPDAVKWNGYTYGRVDIAFTATLTNHTPGPVTVEVRKVGFGTPDSVGQGATMKAVSVFSDDLAIGDADSWWYRFGWPYWWHHLNGAARFDWTVTIEPGQSASLDAAWHVFWR